MAAIDDILRKKDKQQPQQPQPQQQQTASPMVSVPNQLREESPTQVPAATQKPTVTPQSSLQKPEPVRQQTTRKIESAADIVDYLYKNGETAEERERNRKRERRQKIFGAIGDGISAISNLAYTTKGALNSYDPNQGMLPAINKRWEKYHDKLAADAAKTREARLHAYMNDLKIGKDDARADKKIAADAAKQDRQNKFVADENAKKREAAAEENKRNREATAEENRKKRDATAAENEKNRKNARGIASGRNSATIMAAQIRKDGDGDSDKNVWTISDENGGTYDIHKKYNNPSEIGRIFNKLPEDVRKSYQEQETDPLTHLPTGRYKQPSTERMKQAIGEHSSDPAIKKELQRMSGRRSYQGSNAYKRGGNNNIDNDLII